MSHIETKHITDVYAIPGVFSKDECEKIIALQKIWNPSVAQVDLASDSVVDRKYRETMMYNCEIVPGWLYEKIREFSSLANENYRFDISGMMENPTLMEYNSPSGSYDWHLDIGPSPMSSTRKISYSVILNDDFAGGDLEFMLTKDPTRHRHDSGTVIVFPSYILHRVLPVEAGTRWSLVGWIHGNSFR